MFMSSVPQVAPVRCITCWMRRWRPELASGCTLARPECGTGRRCVPQMWWTSELRSGIRRASKFLVLQWVRQFVHEKVMERVEGERRLWEAIPRSGLAMRVADSASMRGTALPPHFAHVATDPVRRVRTGAHAADYGGSAGRTPWRRSSQRSTVHRIAQGEGGEQGDPLMPLLSALGQHQALVAAKNRLAESVFAFTMTCSWSPGLRELELRTQ